MSTASSKLQHKPSVKKIQVAVWPFTTIESKYQTLKLISEIKTSASSEIQPKQITSGHKQKGSLQYVQVQVMN